MKRTILVLAFAVLVIVLGCGAQSMTWKVDCDNATLKTLDRRYTDELYDLKVSEQCGTGPTDNFTDCPEYHTIWRRYWAARRELNQCGPTGTVRS